jgi:DNA invertase Pin-like site-specific DNA recombinase
MFNIIDAMVEFERALIQERLKAGIRNARAKGKRLSRPSKVVDVATVAMLRSQGTIWRAISNRLGLGLRTVYRASNAFQPPKKISGMR